MLVPLDIRATFAYFSKGGTGTPTCTTPRRPTPGLAYVKIDSRHPELTSKTIWNIFSPRYPALRQVQSHLTITRGSVGEIHEWIHAFLGFDTDEAARKFVHQEKWGPPVLYMDGGKPQYFA